MTSTKSPVETEFNLNHDLGTELVSCGFNWYDAEKSPIETEFNLNRDPVTELVSCGFI